MRKRKVWDQDDEHIQASLGNVFYTRTIGFAKPENVASMLANLDNFVRESSAPVGYILHLGAQSTPPEGADRPKIWEMFNKNAKSLAGLAVVIDAEGFKGSMIRSTVTMTFSIYRRGYESSTFDNMISGANWLSPRVNMTQSELVSFAGDTAATLLKKRF